MYESSEYYIVRRMLIRYRMCKLGTLYLLTWYTLSWWFVAGRGWDTYTGTTRPNVIRMRETRILSYAQ